MIVKQPQTMPIQPIKVSPTEDGIRLNRWFGRNYPKSGQGEFRKLCRTGQIRVNAGRCRGNEILHDGDMIRVPPSVTRQGTEQRAKSINSGEKFYLKDLEQLRQCIIHDDPDIVVFNKPAGLATQGGTGIKKSLDKMAAALFPYDTVLLVHRLDRETSGIIVCAKNQRAAQHLAAEFQGKTAIKEYLALLRGVPKKNYGIIDNFMLRGQVLDSEEAEVYGNATGNKPRRAITKYQVLGALPGVVSWVRFMPQTGRTHQLRMHAAFSLKCPIVGEGLYQSPVVPAEEMDNTLKTVIDGRKLFLLAHRLSFRHPRTGKIMTLQAQLPDFMRGAIEFLGFK